MDLQKSYRKNVTLFFYNIYSTLLHNCSLVPSCYRAITSLNNINRYITRSRNVALLLKNSYITCLLDRVKHLFQKVNSFDPDLLYSNLVINCIDIKFHEMLNAKQLNLNFE